MATPNPVNRYSQERVDWLICVRAPASPEQLSTAQSRQLVAAYAVPVCGDVTLGNGHGREPDSRRRIQLIASWPYPLAGHSWPGYGHVQESSHSMQMGQRVHHSE